MDPIADGLTKIRNASRAHHPTVDLKASRLLVRILDVLQQEGFIRAYKPIEQTSTQGILRVYLKYVKATPAISQIVRISKPGMRVYRNARGLPRVLGGLGIAVLSTSRGLMTDKAAFRQRVGGEVVCHVW